MSIAQAYAGHQFGHFTMLGDGRAILLGEQITPENIRYDIQLKGSGKTAYSRGGEDRNVVAVLRGGNERVRSAFGTVQRSGGDSVGGGGGIEEEQQV